MESKKLSTHRVAPGDTLYAISKKYNMTVDEVMDLNKMADFTDIDAEIKMLMRSKSTVSVDLPNKSALDWKIEKKLEIHENEERVLDIFMQILRL